LLAEAEITRNVAWEDLAEIPLRFGKAHLWGFNRMYSLLILFIFSCQLALVQISWIANSSGITGRLIVSIPMIIIWPV